MLGFGATYTRGFTVHVYVRLNLSIDLSAQDSNISIANILEMLKSCPKPLQKNIDKYM